MGTSWEMPALLTQISILPKRFTIVVALAADAAGVRDVEADGLRRDPIAADLLHDACRQAHVDVGDNDGGAVLRELQTDGLADAATTAGDDRNLAVKQSLHVLLLLYQRPGHGARYFRFRAISVISMRPTIPATCA